MELFPAQTSNYLGTKLPGVGGGILDFWARIA